MRGRRRWLLAAVIGLVATLAAVAGAAIATGHTPTRPQAGTASAPDARGDAYAAPSVEASASASPSASPSAKPSAPAGAASSPARKAGSNGRCEALPAFPTPSCTGALAGARLTTISGDITLSKPGQVLQNARVTGSVAITADNVVIRNSEIYGVVDNLIGGRWFKFSITDTTVGPPSGCNGAEGVGSANYTATRVRIRNFSDGFRVSGDHILIQDSFVLLCSNPGDHSDGIQGHLGGTDVTIRHNTIDQRQVRLGDMTAPIFFSDGSKGATVLDNLFAGGGYTVRLHTGDGYTFRGNRIVDGSWVYGPVSSSCSIIRWTDNWLVSVNLNYRVTATKSPLGCA